MPALTTLQKEKTEELQYSYNHFTNFQTCSVKVISSLMGIQSQNQMLTSNN
jgi:hypothetical protein